MKADLMQAIWEQERIGDPIFMGLTLGGLHVGTPLVKANYPGLRAIRLADGTVILAVDLPDSYTVPSTPGATNGPSGVLGYAERTANQTGITTEADLTGLSVTVTVGANRYVRVLGFVRIGSTVVSDRFIVDVKEGATYRGMVGDHFLDSTSVVPIFYGGPILTPSAGTHTYKLTARRISGTGSGTATAAATSPLYIVVEDIGPVTPLSNVGPTELWY